MAGQRLVVLERLDRGIDRAAGVVAEHQDQRRVQHGDAIFQARDRLVGGEIAGDAADEEIAPSAVEGIFGRDARIGAAQDRRIGILAAGQRFALMLEIMPPRHAFDIARICRPSGA